MTSPDAPDPGPSYRRIDQSFDTFGAHHGHRTHLPSETFDTIVIGGGQTGLTIGHHLAQAGRDFVILDAGSRVGDAWRNRWDSLLLFTPARLNGLPGHAVPGPA